MTNLSEKAMLVNVTIKGHSFRKLDKKATQEVNSNNNASNDAGRYNKALIAREYLKDITRISGAIRVYHYTNTLAWSDSGGRILPAKHYIEYMDKMNKLIQEYKEVVQNFIYNYDSYVVHAQNNLGALFNIDEYPHISDIEHKFSVSIHVLPLSTKDDFRVDIQADIAQEIKENIERDFNNSIKNSISDLWDRLKTGVLAMSEKLKNEDAIFRNTLVTNLCDLCNLLEKFNLTEDKNLTAISNEIKEKLCKNEPDILREDKETRKNTAKQAQDILDKMSGYC